MTPKQRILRRHRRAYSVKLASDQWAIWPDNPTTAGIGMAHILGTGSTATYAWRNARTL